MATRSVHCVLLLLALVASAVLPARASLFSLEAAGTITSNSSGDPTIPIGTPWTFKLVYDTSASDLDFELTGSHDPTFGRFTSSTAPPALVFFHYQAGSYQVTVDAPAGFGEFSEILITFTSINAIDINIRAPASFPPLAGGPVSFHADFNAFASAPVLSSDALPTDAALSAGSFDQSVVTLLPPAGAINGGSLSRLTITAIPEPATAAIQIIGLLYALVTTSAQCNRRAQQNGGATLTRA